MHDKINSQTTGNNGRNVIEIPEAASAMDKIKYELANELGIKVPKKKTPAGEAYDWRMVPSYYCGAVGGEMVKRMMQFAEKMAAEGHNVLVKEEGEGTVPHFDEQNPPMPYQGPEGGNMPRPEAQGGQLQ